MKRVKPVAALALAALLLSSPEAAALGAAQGMIHWYASVAPALFPFLALLPLLTCREAARAYEALLGPIMGRLFRLPGGAAPAMVAGMLSGTPGGTIAARRVAAEAGMDRGQLLRLSVAVGGFSPAFLIGGLGAGLLGSAAMGRRLLLAQMGTQLTLAVALRGAWRDRTGTVEPLPGGGDDQPVRGAVLGTLTVCGYMALFGAICAALRHRLGRGIADGLLCLLDVPSGAAVAMALSIPEKMKPVLLAAMCGFGGGCLAAQNLGALRGCGVRPGEYLAARLLAAALEAGYMAALLRLPERPAGRVVAAMGNRPLAAAGLVAALMAIPALAKLGKAIS